MYKILIIEDDAVIASAMKSALDSWGFDAKIAEDLSDIMKAFSAFLPHLVLMDVGLPYFNGFYWCGAIRQSSGVPIIFISSRADDMDIVTAMNMGGDDFIEKPVGADVLVAKVRAMLRRSYDLEASKKPNVRGAEFDAMSMSLTYNGTKYDLTRNEARILGVLIDKKGDIVTREELMLKLWDSDEFIDDNTLTVNVNRLRRTLDGMGLTNVIVTHKSKGYALCE